MPSLPKLFARMANSPLACMNQPFGHDVLATGPGVDGSLPSQFRIRHFQCHAGAAMFVCANANTVVPTPLPPSFVHTAKANSPALLSPPLTLPVGASRSGWAPLAKLSVADPLHWPFPRGRVLLVGGSSGLDAHLMAGLHRVRLPPPPICASAGARGKKRPRHANSRRGQGLFPVIHSPISLHLPFSPQFLLIFTNCRRKATATAP